MTPNDKTTVLNPTNLTKDTDPTKVAIMATGGIAAVAGAGLVHFYWEEIGRALFPVPKDTWTNENNETFQIKRDEDGNIISIVVDTTGDGTVDQTFTEEPLKPLHEPMDLQTATHVKDNMSFDEAFATARSEVSAGGVFVWHGKLYGTYYKTEWDKMSAEQKAEYGEAVHEYIQEHPIPSYHPPVVTQTTTAHEEHAATQPESPQNQQQSPPPQSNATAQQQEQQNPAAQQQSPQQEAVKVGELDRNNDGIVDAELYDTNQDGIVDAVVFDQNQNGKLDAVAVDKNQDGIIDAIHVDTNEDGVIDAICEGGEQMPTLQTQPEQQPQQEEQDCNNNPNIANNDEEANHGGNPDFDNNANMGEWV